MLKFAANLTMLYPELPFLDRFEAAARDGFRAVEVLFPYAWPAAELSARLRGNGLELVMINGTPRANEHERGIAALPGREAEFREGLHVALDYADALSCPNLHVMAGLVPDGATPAERAAMRSRFVEHLAWAGDVAGQQGRGILIEPINPRDMPGFMLNRQDDAHALIVESGSSHVKVQMDLYHCQIVEGDVATKLRRYLPSGRVGLLQVAGVPDRHEPDSGELDIEYLLGIVDESGWDGWTSCEYRPRLGLQPGGTTAGLEWLRRMRSRVA